MFALLYFLMIRPQMKRSKEHKQMTEALQKGDEVVTSGGVLGKITKIGDTYASIEIAPNTEVQVQRSAIQMLLPKGTIKPIWMNRYPLCVYVTMRVALVLGALYTLRNSFGEA